MTKTLEERARECILKAKEETVRMDWSKGSFEAVSGIQEAWNFSMQEWLKQELQAVLDEAKKIYLGNNLLNLCISVVDLERIIKDRMK